MFYIGGRPCIKSDCSLIKRHLGPQFAAASIGSNGGYGEISAGGRGSDSSRLNGWKRSWKHDIIMRSADGKYPVFGCFNQPSGQYAHCIFFMLDKKYPGGGWYNRDCK